MISYTLQARDGQSRPDAAPDAATLDDLRQVFTKTGEMDTEDQFRCGAKADALTVVARNEEANKQITDSMIVAIVPIRRIITFVDKDGTEHKVFVRPDETLGQFRTNNPSIVEKANVFLVRGEPVAAADEGGTYLRGLEKLAVQRPPKADPTPEVLKLLLLSDADKPKAIDWSGGDDKKTLADLREFLKKDAPADLPFLDTSSNPVPRDMEPFETVGSKLGKVAEKSEYLRFRFQSPRKRNVPASTASSGGTASTAAAATAAAAAGGATPTPRETKDLLGGLLGKPGATVAAPTDVLDSMAPADREDLLAALRHLNGLRFVPAADGSYELERAQRAALDAKETKHFVAVVRPITSTRFAASATQQRTLDAISSSLAWNVGGSVGVEGKAASLAVKSDYEDEKTRSQDTAHSELHLRVEYLVARGEVVIDPRSVVLSENLDADLNALENCADELSRVRALARILDSYGTHVPLRTIIGGKLIYRQDRQLDAGTTKETRMRKFTADVQGSYKAVTASAHGGFKDTQSSTNVYESDNQGIEVTASGGNPALALDPYGWAATLSYAGWWNAIAFADVVPLLSLLPDKQKAKILSLVLKLGDFRSELSTPVDWVAYRAQILSEMTRSRNDGEEVTFDPIPAPIPAPVASPVASPVPSPVPSPVAPPVAPPAVTPPPAGNRAEQPNSQSQPVQQQGGEEVEF